MGQAGDARAVYGVEAELSLQSPGEIGERHLGDAPHPQTWRSASEDLLGQMSSLLHPSPLTFPQKRAARQSCPAVSRDESGSISVLSNRRGP